MKSPLLTDRDLLDWLDEQSNGDPWVARRSQTGRGYRLHNTSNPKEFDRIGAETVRGAIQEAILKAGAEH